MINKKILRVCSVVALALGLYSCNNDTITTLNKNPNSPEDVPPGPLFTEAARLSVSRWFGGIDLRTYEWIVQQLSEVQYNDEDRYLRVHAADTEGSFNGAYSGELKDLTQIIAKGQATSDPGIYAPAYALRTLDFSFVTDSWGDIPYSQALKGDSVGTSLTPAVRQAEGHLHRLLRGSRQGVEGSCRRVQWPGRCRSDLRRRPGELAEVHQLASSAVGDPRRQRRSGACERADRCRACRAGWADSHQRRQRLFPVAGRWRLQQSVGGNLGGRDDWRMSDRLVNIMNATSDPRLPIYAQPAASDGAYRGSPNGVLPAPPNMPDRATTSRPGVIFYKGATVYGPTFGGAGASLPTPVLTAAEVNFILAEASERGLGGLTAGTAAAYYNAGISALLNQWNDMAASSGQSISAGAMATYLASPSVVYTGGVTGQKQIAQQKYIALYMDGATAWFEWRRTCVPNTIVPGPDATLNYVPRRLEYPTTEATANGDALKAAIAAQGPDNLGTKLWWDTQTAPTCT